MNLKHLSAFTKQHFLLLITAALLLPALLTNLGLVAFYGDEGIRSLVALEMKISGNYLTPTLFGEFYYNKPPLYNWILLAVFELTGRTDEFIARLTTVFFLLVYASSVYFFLTRLLHWKKNQDIPAASPRPAFIPGGNTGFPALLTALGLITCGRILFWDSLLSLIDICFSWVMYLLFMVIYQQGEKERYRQLFAWAYLLAATGFLLKGLPSVVFLGLALLTYFIWQKKWRQLISWAHLGGIAVFALTAGSYYALYAQHNGLNEVFKTLFVESAKRTFLEYGVGQTLLHFLTFPFEMWYHFLPWTLMAVYFFRKNAWQLIRQNKFITWSLLVFGTTLLPYWSSVEVYPRYLFMHVPLVFSAFFYLHFENGKEGSRWWQFVEGVFGVICLLTTLTSMLLPFWEEAKAVPFSGLKTAFLVASLGLLSWLYQRWKTQRMFTFVIVLLVARLGFDWFVLPSRLNIECSTQVRQTTIEAVKKLEGRPVYIYKHSLGFQPVTGYYFTRETSRILKKQHENFDKNALYIVHTGLYNKNLFEKTGEITVLWECGTLVTGRIRE